MATSQKFRKFFQETKTLDIFSKTAERAIIILLIANICIMFALIGAEKLELTSPAKVNTPLGKIDTLLLNGRATGQETPYPHMSSSNHADKAYPMSDRVTVPGEKNGEKVSEERESTQSLPMPLSEAFKEKLALYFLTISLLFLGHKLENTERPSGEVLVRLCRSYWASPRRRNITRLLMCEGCSAPPPPTALESDGLEMSLINIHPQSVLYGLSWTVVIFGLIVIGIVIFKIWPLIQHWIDEKRHAVELRMQRRELLLNFAGQGIPMSEIRRNPGGRQVSLANMTQESVQLNDSQDPPSTPSAPSLADCKCRNCKDLKLYPGLRLTPNCTRK